MISRFFSRRLMVLVAATASLLTSHADDETFSYIPDINGVFRGRWEVETTNGYSHFQVRNARLSVSGKVAPILSYMFNTDLCDRGKILILDAYANVLPARGVNINVGQYRMPFGIESFRGPGTYFFSNRSYIGKYVNNYRAVGVSAGYTLPSAPLSVEAGVFNPTVIEDHSTWVKKYAYAGRIQFTPSGWLFATGFESIIPGATRINLFSVTARWTFDHLLVEGEYMARMYSHKAHKTTNAFNIFANYDFPLKKGLFDIWSVQARFDGMTDLASGTTADSETNSKLATTQQGRKRLTLGTTLDYKYKRLRASICLNYEKCWFDNHVTPAKNKDDLVCAELIVKF